MSIELFQTMQWSKLCWDFSFQKILKIDDALPKIGRVYPVKFEKNEDSKREGRVKLLWCPPHSELNGWDDNRPSEILKSYVISGELKNKNTKELSFYFEVENRILLTKFFEQIPIEKKSPLSYIGSENGASVLQWRDASGLLKSKVGDYWYLSGSESETSLEVIFSIQNKHICLHYSATLNLPSVYKTVVTNYYLTEVESSIFNDLLNRAQEIVEESVVKLGNDEVLGAEYY